MCNSLANTLAIRLQVARPSEVVLQGSPKGQSNNEGSNSPPKGQMFKFKLPAIKCVDFKLLPSHHCSNAQVLKNAADSDFCKQSCQPVAAKCGSWAPSKRDE